MEGASRGAYRRVAWVLCGLSLALLVAVFVLGSLNGAPIDAEEIALSLVAVVGIGTSATVGAMVASRHPRNPIGWLLLVFALGIVVGILSEEYVVYALDTHPGALPAPGWAAWVTTWAWISAIAIPLVLLLFPTGTPPSPRWRWIPRVLLVAAVWVAFFFATDPRPVSTERISIVNPAGIPGLLGAIDELIAIGGVTALLASVACFAGLVVRFRRARGEERQQLKWLAYPACVALGALGLLFVTDMIGGSGQTPEIIDTVLWTMFVFALMAGVPLACGIAILRYRLYDLDVVVKKTVVFGVLVAFVTLMYVLAVVVIGTAVTGADAAFGGTFFAVAAVVALAVQPLRTWARRFADRVVYGKRATPYEVLSDFTSRLGDAYSVEDVAPRIAELITGGTGATRAAVWLRSGARLRREAVAPANADRGASELPMPDGTLPTIPDATATIPVLHQGELLGAIELEIPPADPLTPAQERVLAELATQAGLALRNVALAADLRRRLEELQRSRQRLVSAQDEERRKLERNLHDGAQQQLVALGVKLRLLDQLIDRDAAKAHELLATIQGESVEAIDALRDLARGIYPPVLADRGLVAALEGQVRKAPLPVTVRANGVGRFAQEVEAATYFCILEALQNVAKYADASSAVVTLAAEEEALRFEVSDDGSGFDPATAKRGAGLQNMEDRLAALGGEVTISSRPGAGTLVSGRIPTRI